MIALRVFSGSAGSSRTSRKRERTERQSKRAGRLPRARAVSSATVHPIRERRSRASCPARGHVSGGRGAGKWSGVMVCVCQGSRHNRVRAPLPESCNRRLLQRSGVFRSEVFRFARRNIVTRCGLGSECFGICSLRKGPEGFVCRCTTGPPDGHRARTPRHDDDTDGHGPRAPRRQAPCTRRPRRSRWSGRHPR